MLRALFSLLTASTAVFTLTSYASSDPFVFSVGNHNFEHGIVVDCNGPFSDAAHIRKLVIPQGSNLHTSLKQFYTFDSNPLMQICRFSSAGKRLGSITLRFVLDPRDGDIKTSFIAANDLKKNYAEIKNYQQAIYIYFKK